MSFKNILSFIIFFIIIGLSLSCNESTPIEPEYGNSFFPLKVGNTWFYNSFSSSCQQFNPNIVKEIKKVIGTKNIMGRTFYSLESIYKDDSGSIYSKDTSYYYYSNDTLYHYMSVGNNKYNKSIYAIFSLESGDKYIDTVGTTVNEITVREKNNEWAIFSYDAPQVKDEENEVTFRKGKGIYEIYSPSSTVITKLIKANLLN
jgi:hypothetical protein